MKTLVNTTTLLLDVDIPSPFYLHYNIKQRKFKVNVQENFISFTIYLWTLTKLNCKK